MRARFQAQNGCGCGGVVDAIREKERIGSVKRRTGSEICAHCTHRDGYGIHIQPKPVNVNW